MNRAVWVVVLLSLPALAADPVTEVSVSEPASTGRFALSVATASVVSISSSVLGGVVALSVPNFCTERFGSPRPLCGAAGLALAGLTQMVISVLAIPEVFRISGADPAQVRAAWWRWARWPAVVLAASAVVFLVGAAVEQKHFGNGQGTMVAGLGGATVSGISLDVMGIIGAARAARGLR